MTMTELCAELRNYFDRGLPRCRGDFVIENGRLKTGDKITLLDGQFYRIEGSVFNNGVHQYGSDDLIDESFEGSVRAMAVPPAVIALLGKMNDWEDKYAEKVMSPYSSEDISGVYSYTKAQGGSVNNGGSSGITAFDMFARELNKWRKI